MPRDGSNQYHVPPGTDGITNFTLESTKYNAFIHDVEADQNNPRPIVAGGTGASDAHTAMVNLSGEITNQVVTNYDSFPFVPGSFYSAAGATSAPVAGHAFAGICYQQASNFQIVEARDLNDTVQPPRKYIRYNAAGVWGAWYVDGRTVIGSNEGISGTLGDMFFGISGTSPNSAFIVNNKADSTGNNLIQVAKNGGLAVNGLPGNQSTLTMNAPASGLANTFYGLVNSKFRFSLQLGDGVAESGSNTGSNFAIARYNDAGTFLGSALSITRADGTVSVAGSLQSGGAIWSYPTATTGAYNFGNSGTKNLTYDGTSFSLSGGVLNVGAGVTANGNITTNGGALVTATTATTGNVFFGNGFTRYLAHDGTSFNLSGGPLVCTGNITATGVQGRNGTAGTPSGAMHNWYFTGVLAAWLDTTSLGNVTLTSDYRIKKDVIDLPGMWDTVKALRPIKYTQAQFSPPSHIEYQAKAAAEGKEATFTHMFEADDVERWGFIAHELQATLTPSAASGVKDSPNEIQSPNPFTVIAALTKALQEAMTRIEALEAGA